MIERYNAWESLEPIKEWKPEWGESRKLVYIGRDPGDYKIKRGDIKKCFVDRSEPGWVSLKVGWDDQYDMMYWQMNEFALLPEKEIQDLQEVGLYVETDTVGPVGVPGSEGHPGPIGPVGPEIYEDWENLEPLEEWYERWGDSKKAVCIGTWNSVGIQNGEIVELLCKDNFCAGSGIIRVKRCEEIQYDHINHYASLPEPTFDRLFGNVEFKIYTSEDGMAVEERKPKAWSEGAQMADIQIRAFDDTNDPEPVPLSSHSISDILSQFDLELIEYEEIDSRVNVKTGLINDMGKFQKLLEQRIDYGDKILYVEQDPGVTVGKVEVKAFDEYVEDGIGTGDVSIGVGDVSASAWVDLPNNKRTFMEPGKWYHVVSQDGEISVFKKKVTHTATLRFPNGEIMEIPAPDGEGWEVQTVYEYQEDSSEWPPRVTNMGTKSGVFAEISPGAERYYCTEHESGQMVISEHLVRIWSEKPELLKLTCWTRTIMHSEPEELPLGDWATKYPLLNGLG